MEQLYKQYKLQYAVKSDVGKVRGENQDCYSYSKTGKAQLFVVADGIGGAFGGEIASFAVCRVLSHHAFSADGRITEESLSKAIERANHVVYYLGNNYPEFSGMGTTVAVLGISGTECIIAYIGDSRIYCMSQGKLVRISEDHTVAGELLKNNSISENLLKNSGANHILTRSIGQLYTAHQGAEIKTVPLHPGCSFLLCSDGLTGLVNDEKISEIMRSEESSLNSIPEKLVAMANDNGGRDNVTAMVVKVDEVFSEEPLRLLNQKVVDVVLPRNTAAHIDFDNIDKTLQSLAGKMPPTT